MAVVFLLSLVPVQLPCRVLATSLTLLQAKRNAGNFISTTPLCKQCSLFSSLSWMVLEFPSPCDSCGCFPPLRSLCLCLGLFGSSAPLPVLSSWGQVCEERKKLLAMDSLFQIREWRMWGASIYYSRRSLLEPGKSSSCRLAPLSFHPLLWVMWVVYFFIAALAENN